jgi:hypothetical protein
LKTQCYLQQHKQTCTAAQSVQLCSSTKRHAGAGISSSIGSSRRSGIIRVEADTAAAQQPSRAEQQHNATC